MWASFLPEQVGLMAPRQEMRGIPSGQLAVREATIHPLHPEEDFFSPEIPVRSINLEGSIDGTRVDLTIKVPEQALTPPLIVFPGLVGVKASYENFGVAAAARGTPTVLVKPLPMRGRVILGAVRAAQDYLATEQFDAVAHSKGGHTLTSADHASLRSIIFAGSAGLDGHNIVTFAWRLPIFMATEFWPAVLSGDMARVIPAGKSCFDVSGEVIEYACRHPFRAAADVWVTSNCDIRPAVERMRDNKVRMALLLLLKDRLLPPAATLRRSGHLFDHIEEMPNAGHTVFQTEPERAAKAVLALVQRINAAEEAPRAA